MTKSSFFRGLVKLNSGIVTTSSPPSISFVEEGVEAAAEITFVDEVSGFA